MSIQALRDALAVAIIDNNTQHEGENDGAEWVCKAQSALKVQPLTLYALRLSFGRPRQRVFRETRECIVSAATLADAHKCAHAMLANTVPANSRSRIEQHTELCQTMTFICVTGGLFTYHNFV